MAIASGGHDSRLRFHFDAHVEKTFSVAGARVAGIVDVFNLLNTRNEVEEDVTTGPTFRAPTAIQPPRAARLGFRILSISEIFGHPSWVTSDASTSAVPGLRLEAPPSNLPIEVAFEHGTVHEAADFLACL
jgi:hypothetical protein